VADQKLIYKITRAVYDRLGSQADASLVEGLVTDVYRVVEGSLEEERPPEGNDGTRRDSRVVISAFGLSRPGIVAAISATLAESNVNIIDMNQTVVQGKFAMVLIAEMGSGAADLATLKTRLNEAGERFGIRVYAQREDLFQTMHRI
jgi:ACT domain-containing protein